ncbi:MAG: PKD domain-containing protein [Bacteroidales bacterium]
MKPVQKTTTLITFLLLSISYGKSQINADFTMNVQAGCSPLKVSFINQSAPAGSLTYSWYLGEQQGTSTLENPQATYITPDSYDVKLVVQQGLQKDSVIKTIIVYKNPTAKFTSLRQGCVPFQVQFNDLSIPGDGQIEKWYWDFRTGDTLTVRNPLKTFTFPGQYDIYFEVTDVHGCKDFVDSLKYIDVVNPPVANFSVSPVSACQTPVTFTFTNQSVVQGTVSYNWDFGDGTQSQQTNPSKTYNAFNNYPVRLTVTSDHGCADDTVKTAYVSEVVASGILRQNEKPLTANDTICLGIFDFSNTSTGTDNVRWIFDDGTTLTSKFGFHEFTVAKTYNVKLIASPGTVCADTFTWTLVVEDIKADFSMNTDYSCMSPVDITFTDLSVNAVKWEWTFSDNTKSYTRNTSHTFSLSEETDEYAINEAETFVTALTVESPGGCKATKLKPLTIKKPTSQFTVDKASGCVPLTIKFKDKSIPDLPANTITNWEWIFSETQKSSGAADSAVFTYNTNGTFPSKLVITNNKGCKDTSYIIDIMAGKKLLPDFNVSPTDVCQNDQITLLNTTPESGLIQRWHYQVGGVDVNSPPDEPNPQWIMHADTGWLDIKLEVDYNGCISDTVKKKVIHNKGPVAFFSYNFSCGSPFDYSFTNLSKGLETFQWKFGDGAENTTNVNTSHSYATEGNYLVELTVNKGGCSDKHQVYLPVREPKAIISGEVNACVGQPLALSGSGSYGTVDYCHERYLWDFGDTLAGVYTISDTVFHTYIGRGNYTVKLKTDFDNGCRDSTTFDLTVFQPYVGFEPDTLLGCSPFIVNFTDTSTANVHTLDEWTWSFGTGYDSTYNSQVPVISHWFNNPGVYQVSLVVTDTLGCRGTANATISTANPNAEFFVVKPNICLGDEISVNYYPQSIDSMIWDFGDGLFSGSTAKPVTHTYLDSGRYYANLTIWRYGCSASHTQLIPTIVQLADARFEVSDTFWNCYPHEVIFNHDITGQAIVSGIWNFGYGNTPPSAYSKEKIFTYPKPGNYKASLSIVTSFGCMDTASRQILITGPTGDFAISSEYACKGDEIRFDTLYTDDVFDYEWDMGDGTEFKKGSPVFHNYSNVGPFYPKLLLYGDSGRCKPPALVDTLLIAEVVADFVVPDTGMCDTYPVTLENTSTGNLTNNWKINDAVYTTDVNPSLVLVKGNYNVTLMVQNDIGCRDTVVKSFVAHPLPDILIKGDTLICEGDAITLWVTGGDEVFWSPASGLSAVTSYSPVASPDITTRYTAIARYAATGCRSIDNITVFVQQAPEFTVLPEDTTIIVGEIIKVRIDSLGDFTYLWSSVPADINMNCETCAGPYLLPLINTGYTLMVADTNNCFTENYYISVIVNESYTVDVPTAFKPAGDPEDAVVYVKGHGIMRLVEFRIFNRYGNEVFFSDDLGKGWDGTYNGKLQNIDSYAYTVTVEMWNGQIMNKKGTITLLR